MILLEPGQTPYDIHFRIFGVPVRVSPWFWVFSAILFWHYTERGFAFLALAVLCCFVSILIHELGHIFMGRCFGTDGYIVLYSFGGLAVGSNNVPYRWQRIAVSFAGPLAQLILYGCLRLLVRQESVAEALLNNRMLLVTVALLLDINLYWPLLNLLPVWPLDGGQISREVFSAINPRQGLRWSLGLSVLCAGLLAVNALFAMNGKPLIPYFDGGMWTLVLFGSLALSSYQALQQLGQYDDDNTPSRYERREPWEQDPDYWKR